MPRMSNAEKEKSHARVIEAAAFLFRQNGIGSTSISDVMQHAGLTHGGFYRHFSSKEELVSAAFDHAITELADGMESAGSETELDQARQDYIDRYLSLDHVANAGGGCPVAAMGGEIMQLGGDVKERAGRAMERTTALLHGPKDRPDAAGIAIFSMLVGTITLARMAPTNDEASAIIEAGKTSIARMLGKGD